MDTDSNQESTQGTGEPELPPFMAEFEHRFFDGAQQVTIEVTLMRDTWESILEECEKHAWKQNEGLIVLLTTGMAFLRVQRALSVGGDVAGLRDEDVRRLLNRLVEIESRFAAIKNFAFDMMRDHRVMETQHVAIERTAVGYERLAARLREENLALRAENDGLKQRLESSGAAEREELAAEPVVERSLWQRALRALADMAGRTG